MSDKNQLLISMRANGFSHALIERTSKLLDCLTKSNVENVTRFITKLKGRLNDEADFIDIWVEGWAALLFAHNAFGVKYDPSQANEGPDLLIKGKGNNIFVEVTRFREDVAITEELQTKGAISRSSYTATVWGKIIEKYKQCVPNEINLILLRNDSYLDEPEVGRAMDYIRGEIENNPGTGSNLSSVLFDNVWDAQRPDNTVQRFYLFRNNGATKQIPHNLARRFEELEPHLLDYTTEDNKFVPFKPLSREASKKKFKALAEHFRQAHQRSDLS